MCGVDGASSMATDANAVKPTPLAKCLHSIRVLPYFFYAPRFPLDHCLSNYTADGPYALQRPPRLRLELLPISVLAFVVNGREEPGRRSVVARELG